MSSLDPRVNRLDLKKISDGEEQTNSHLITWEVFHQERRGRQAIHAGVVHANSPEMALVVAKEVFGRRGKTSNIWVVKSSDVFAFPVDDEDMFETTPDKTFRDPSAYKVRDRIENFRNKKRV